MKTGIDEMMETQKKMFDSWKEWTDQWMKSASETTQAPSGKDFFVPWMDMQRKWMEDMQKAGRAKSPLESAPQQWKDWMDTQAQLNEKWMDFYGKGMHPAWGMKPWESWMEESNKWIRENMLDKIPNNMKPHYQNFTALYDEFAKYWDAIQRMIQFGSFSKNTTDQFFSPEAYRRVMGMFMGFRPVDDANKLIQDVNTFFEDYINALKKMTPGSHEYIDGWTRFMRDWGRQSGHPGLQAVADMTNMVEKGINSFYHVAGPSEELAMAKVMKDIQFAYVAFLTKSAELQRMMMDAGQFALPDTVQEFYTEFQKTQKLPNYTEFFNRYANVLEDALMDALESKEYSLLQAEVSKLGITVKAKMDEFVELAFNDFPFLMKSFADEVAQENTSLRRKVRDLENRLYLLESIVLGGSAVPKEKTPAKPARTTTTTKKTTK